MYAKLLELDWQLNIIYQSIFIMSTQSTVFVGIEVKISQKYRTSLWLSGEYLLQVVQRKDNNDLDKFLKERHHEILTFGQS